MLRAGDGNEQAWRADERRRLARLRDGEDMTLWRALAPGLSGVPPHPQLLVGSWCVAGAAVGRRNLVLFAGSAADREAAYLDV